MDSDQTDDNTQQEEIKLESVDHQIKS